MGIQEESLKFIRKELLPNKDFISLFGDFIGSSATMFSPQVVLDRLFEYIVPTYKTLISEEERKMYVIYRLFVNACGKRIISNINNDRSFADSASGKVLVIDSGKDSWLDEKGFFLSAVTVVTREIVAQLHFIPYSAEDFGDKINSEYLDWPVKLFYAHQNIPQNTNYKQIKLKEINWNNILDWFRGI